MSEPAASTVAQQYTASLTAVQHRPHHPPASPAGTQSAKEPHHASDQERIDYIIETFLKNFGDGMRKNPDGWRGRFRKMAADEFAFYRGSAVLFYRDLYRTLDQDPWLKASPKAASVFIHGDLHAENFGTYIDRYGIINFDVNDFDEGFIGPFTWDVKRLVASINLIAYSKAYSDAKIEKLLTDLVHAYVAQIHRCCKESEKHLLPISSENTRGPVNRLLKEARLGSKEAHLNKMTMIDNYERRFIRSDTVKDVDDELRHQLLMAFQEYIRTIPENKRERTASYQVKDIVARSSPGIGSAGKISYNILIQGKTQALETDAVIYMKPASPSAVASVLGSPDLEKHFKHDGLRTVLCAYAMHAVTTRWLGYTTLNNEIPMFVDEVSAHNLDLEWDDINDFEELCLTAQYVGIAMAKIHSIADVGSIDREKHARQHTELIPFNVIPLETEIAIRDAFVGKEEAFIKDMVQFAMAYGNIVRRDHRLFFETFRNEKIPILNGQ